MAQRRDEKANRQKGRWRERNENEMNLNEMNLNLKSQIWARWAERHEHFDFSPIPPVNLLGLFFCFWGGFVNRRWLPALLRQPMFTPSQSQLDLCYLSTLRVCVCVCLCGFWRRRWLSKCVSLTPPKKYWLSQVTTESQRERNATDVCMCVCVQRGWSSVFFLSCWDWWKTKLFLGEMHFGSVSYCKSTFKLLSVCVCIKQRFAFCAKKEKCSLCLL